MFLDFGMNIQSQARYAGGLPCDHRQEVVARTSVHEPKIPRPPLRIRQIGIKLLFLQTKLLQKVLTVNSYQHR